MTIKQIQFNTEAVKAILNGKKVTTRRVIDIPANSTMIRAGKTRGENSPFLFLYNGGSAYAPYHFDDVLYVQETWDNIPVSPGGNFRPSGRYYYKADGDLRPVLWKRRWRSCAHMPREAARIFLHVTDIWAERLQEITALGVCGEGASHIMPAPGEYAEKDLTELYGRRVWDRAIKPADRKIYGWDANPWVWVIVFKQCEKPENWEA